MKPGLKIAIGVFMALLTMSFVVIYDIYIKDKIDSVEVVTVKTGEVIEKNDPIESGKLTVELREKRSLIDGVITADKMSEIIGVEAGQKLVGNSMISNDMLNLDSLIPNEEKGEAIRPIIAEWIYATPGSLRRKDTIDIYVVKLKDEQLDQQTNVIVSGEGEEDKTDSMDVVGPILEEVKVIYAKDHTNKEVTGNSENGERLDATAQIADIEVILNEDEFKTLMDYVIKKNYKLYITYN